MKACIVGLGYIGLPTAIMLASHGVETVGVDRDAGRLETLREGVLPFEEDGMEALFRQALRNGLTFESTCPAADVYIISVPTPYLPESRKIDPAFVVTAVRDVLQACPRGAVIVIESTVSPGTVDRFVRPEIERAGFFCGRDVHLAHAPERIIPGNMIYELEHNSRVIGADDPAVGERVGTVYKSFCRGDVVVTDVRTAEMTKVIENTYRDINIAFANELLKICREDGLDAYEVIRIANMHPRVNILQPGPGAGGHCISVDPWFLVGDYPDTAKLILQARTVNDGMPDYVLKRIASVMEENRITDPDRVGLYGLTYKENVDDTRESPTLQLLSRVKDRPEGGFRVYDPMVKRDAVPNQYHDLDAFLADVDMVVVIVGHGEIVRNQEKLNGKVVLDTRNVIKLPKVYHL